MAQATFHKNQRVWVKPVGTWASIEKVMPVWVKGVEEPIRIFYEVGLGREFAATELQAENKPEDVRTSEGEKWRILRQKNKWQSAEECSHHPFPGSFPVVVTDDQDWGGWRIPGAEYDRDPARFERQARVISASPAMLAMLRKMVTHVSENSDEMPSDLMTLAREATRILEYIYEKAPAQHVKLFAAE
jgi:hypothetical protein